MFMVNRRRDPRHETLPGRRTVTIHGTQGPVLGQATDESTGGLGIYVADPVGLSPGQMVLVHRFHESDVQLGQIRHIARARTPGYLVGIRWLADSVGDGGTNSSPAPAVAIRTNQQVPQRTIPSPMIRTS
jgi:hypothetical protein